MPLNKLKNLENTCGSNIAKCLKFILLTAIISGLLYVWVVLLSGEALLSRQIEVKHFNATRLPDLSSSGISTDIEAQPLIAELGCGSCHVDLNILVALKGRIPDLSSTGRHYNPAYLFDYLQNPLKVRQHLGRSRMPDFHFSEEEALALTLFLTGKAPDSTHKPDNVKLNEFYKSLGQAGTRALEDAYNSAQKAFPSVNAVLGKQIFLSQNCIACHPSVSLPPVNLPLAPPLADEANRVKNQWLKNYLKNPYPLRPFGFLPGTGSRMPDFGLSDEEVYIISEYLIRNKGRLKDKSLFKAKVLSAFSMKKAKALLQNKLSCLGCHRLEDTGGKIGPDLTNSGARLQPSYIFDIIKDPQKQIPHSIMPEIPMPEEWRELIANFLIQNKGIAEDPVYLSLIENPITFYGSKPQPQRNYLQNCAPCHGVAGGANGYNVQFIQVLPTVFAHKEYMSKRPDDTLFDGVFAGGYILNKSHLMPPWGETLSRREIEDLVSYMRELCECRGPRWSQ